MSFTIRNITAEEIGPYIRTMFWAAGRAVDDQFVREQAAAFELGRAMAAFEGGDLVGTIGTRSLRLTLPGGKCVDLAGLGQGGVLPSHTRRGAMRQLMMHALRDALDRDEPLAGWTTSEWPLYERYGGGPASFSAAYAIKNIGRAALRDLTAGNGRTAIVSSAQLGPQLPDLHQRSATQPGAVPRNAAFWGRVVARADGGLPSDVLDSRRDLPAALYAANFSAIGSLEGCAVYRIHQTWDGGVFKSELEVMHLFGTSDAVQADLFRFLLTLDLVDSIRMPHRPEQEPLRWLLIDGRRLQTLSTEDHIWLRLLDPLRVLQLRQYPKMSEPLRIGIRDELGLAPSGVLEINSDGREADVTWTKKAAEAELGVGQLSSLLLGGVDVWGLVASGQIQSPSTEFSMRLGAAFTSGPRPFTDTSF